MSDIRMVCARCGNMKPGAYAGTRLPDFCKCDAPTDLARLMAENELLKKDAERYRWLRKNGYDHCDSEQPCVMLHKQDSYGNWKYAVIELNQLDRAIDAALKGEQK